jgi:hypothetical protein
MGRRPIGDAAMTDAERQQRRRARAKALRASQPAPAPGAARKSPRAAPDILALDADAIAACIIDGVPAEKASRIAASLQRRLWSGRLWPG